MYKEHPSFERPDDENVRIWRYMYFTKFVSLLDKAALFFSRADRLGDPFEGSYSKANINLRPDVYKDMIPPIQLEIYSEWRKFIVKNTVINCWHLNQNESADMWKLYLKSNEGIAIRSTFNRLKSSLRDEKHEILIGKVKYIDYRKEWLPETSTFEPFIHKRKSFEHEQELRAVIQEYCYTRNGEVDWYSHPFTYGIYIPVYLNLLIEKIYLAPTSPKWLFELVKSVIKKYSLNKDVRQSSLDDKPVY